MFVFGLISGTASGQATVTLDISPLKADTIVMVDDGKVTYSTPSLNGTCTFRFDAGFPKQITLSGPGKERLRLYIEKGDSLYIASTLNGITPVFSGKGAGNAKVYYQLFNSLKASWDAIDESTVKAGTPTDLDNRFDIMFLQGFDILETNRKIITPAFYESQKIFMYYQHIGFKLDVPYWYKIMTGKKLSASIPDHYWDLAKSVPFNDSLLDNEAYTSCLFSNLPDWYTWQYKFKSGSPDSTFAENDLFMNKYRRVEKEYTGKTRSATLRILIAGRIESSKDASVVKPLMDEYLHKYGHQEDTRSLLEAYRVATSLTAGQTPPPFVLKDVNGKDVRLTDFAGKVIYMDFWASWCGPCRKQMKEGAPKLHKMFEGNNEIVFLYINMDEKVDLAKEAITQDNIEGIHLFSGGFQAHNETVKAFNISGIPRYLIIGKDGKIFDNNASRPSEDITVKYLNDALKAH